MTPLPDPMRTLPANRDLYYGGAWRKPASASYFESCSPGSGVSLGQVADANAADVDAVVRSASEAFPTWRDTLPLERAAMLREIAARVRTNARELATIDALDCGNPVEAMMGDAAIAATQLEMFAGLVTEMKGDSVPMGPGRLNVSVREPVGVVARISPFNHPFMFAAAKIAAPLAAGNTVVVKPPEQAPLSALRLAELVDDLLPPGVFNVVTGSSREVGVNLVAHPKVNSVALIGSVAAGQAVMHGAADGLKPVLLELGGKNALVACEDADPDTVASAMVAGMNFAWCGQSCGSTSRAFLHARIHDQVLERLPAHLARFRPGLPERAGTTMGALASKAQYDRTLRYIELGCEDGARLLTGGKRPDAPELSNGFFVEPTVFADVTPTMRIAREEVFGPVLSILSWRDEAQLVEDVNSVELGLTASIWTRDISRAMRLSSRIEAGFVWINEVSRHFPGAPFGGRKLSGIGREECLDELLHFTEVKNIHVKYEP